MTEVWALPGYDVQALLGYGASGELWRARELATGELVALKRLPADVDPEALAALRRAAPVLRDLDTPYVVRVRALVGEGPDTVLVLDLATGGSLAALLARRGTLDPAEVVTVAAPLAQALAAAHAAGLIHGDVTAANVVFTAEGMPLLADLGMALLSGSPADAASDVESLGALCHQLLSGVLPATAEDPRAPLGLLAPSAPRPLVAAVEQALSADPSSRPDAAAFASALRRSHAAAPVRFGEPAAPAVASAPATAPPSRVVPVEEPRRSRRPLVVAAAAAAVVVLAAGVGWASGRSGPVELASAAVPAAPDWTAVLDRLDAARSQAFATGNAAALSAADAPGSRLLGSDRAALQHLVGSGRRARGVRHVFRQVDVTSYDERRATLRVVDELAAYDVVDSSGRVVARAAARPAAAFVVTLVQTPEGWRLAAVVPA